MENKKKGAAPKKQNDEKVKTIGVVVTKKNAKVEPVVLSLEEKVAKVQLMHTLVNKRIKLNRSIEKLDSFSLANDGMETTLTISEGKYSSSKEFMTSNTIIIDDVAEFLKGRIFKQLEKIEKEIESLV